MSSSTIRVTIAVRKTTRWPYHAVRILGSRAKPKAGEVAIPMRLEVDDLLFSKVTNLVAVNVQAPAPVSGGLVQEGGAS